MRIIGLTGSIACGKSTITQHLRSQNLPVIDGDELARRLTAPGSPVLGEIRKAFGDAYFSESGSLNRRSLGRLVFNDPAARQKLDDLMAPHLLSLTKEEIVRVRNTCAPLCFLDMPLLFEKGYNSLCHAVWTVWLPKQVQLSRLMERDGFSEKEALSRIRAVMSSDQKAALADQVIDNSGSIPETLARVDRLLEAELNPQKANPSAVSRTPQPEQPSAALRRPSAQPYSQPMQTRSVQAAEPPTAFDRPEAAQRKSKRRNAQWRMPVWLRNTAVALCAMILLGIAFYSWQLADLRSIRQQHLDEQAAVDAYYPLPAKYVPMIRKYAEEYNLSPAFVSAVIRNESSFNPEAESGVGARGLMQLMPDTAEWIAHKLGVQGYAFERMKDPESNIRFGCWYLNYLSRLFGGQPVCVIAAYHAGQGQVAGWLSDITISDDGITLLLDRLPEGPTKNYTGRVTRDYGIYLEKYFTEDPGADAADPADDASLL